MGLGGDHEVGGLDVGGAAVVADAAGDVFQRFAAAAGEDDGGALIGEGECGGFADAAAGAGDPGDFAREFWACEFGHGCASFPFEAALQTKLVLGAKAWGWGRRVKQVFHTEITEDARRPRR